MKKKLSLKDLKVKSFVTEVEKAEEVKGASGLGCLDISDRFWSVCQTCGIYC